VTMFNQLAGVSPDDWDETAAAAIEADEALLAGAF
jgi:hypothetical protein